MPSRPAGAARAAHAASFIGAALLLLAALAVGSTAHAQGGAAPKTPAKLATLNIEIWPEYDKPAALVILRGALADGVKLPAAVTLRLPAPPLAVAYSQTAEGNLLNLRNEQTQSGGDTVVKFDAPERFFHIEFYQPMSTADPARSFRYVWPGDLAVDQASVVVQEPAAAMGLVTEPNLGTTSTGQEGFNYRVGDIGALPAGKPLPISVKYTKPDPRPSVQIRGIRTADASAPAAAPAPVQAPMPAATGGLPAWAVPLGGAVVLALLGVALIVWIWKRQSAAPAAPAITPTAFCRKCGASLTADSNFCAKCGTKVAAKAGKK